MRPAIERLIGYRFHDGGLLEEALTHKSYAYERGAARHNERLEFLGDSALAAVVARLLFIEHPEEDEGRLSKMKSTLVSRGTLAIWARDLGIGPFLLLGQGEESTGGRDRSSILSNALEALIGAVYLDGGFEAAHDFIHRCFLDGREEFVETDFKSRLQEVVQKRHKVPPDYETVETEGPDHDKTFRVRVRLGKKLLGSGEGKTKKDAEQEAARDALARLGPPPKGKRAG